MNATEKTRALNTHQFLSTVENFHNKVRQGKPSSGDVQAFYKIIEGSKTSSISGDAQGAEKIIQELKKLMESKEIIEITTGTIQIPLLKAIQETIDSLRLFLKNQERESGKVSRKDTDQLPG